MKKSSNTFGKFDWGLGIITPKFLELLKYLLLNIKHINSRGVVSYCDPIAGKIFQIF